MFKRFRFLIGVVLSLVLTITWSVLPLSAQLPTLPSLPSPSQSSQQRQPVLSKCIYLQGRCLFKIAGGREIVTKRVIEIEDRLETFSEIYFKAPRGTELEIRAEIAEIRPEDVATPTESEPSQQEQNQDAETSESGSTSPSNPLQALMPGGNAQKQDSPENEGNESAPEVPSPELIPAESPDLLVKPEEVQPRNIFLSLSGTEDEVRLMTVTSQDADFLDQSIPATTEEYIAALEEGLEEAKEERQPEGLVKQLGIAALILLGMVLLVVLINKIQASLRKDKEQINLGTPRQVSRKLSEQQAWNLKEIQHRVLQTIEVGVWIFGTLTILDLFPYTRPIRAFLIFIFQIPLRFVIVGVVTYLVIRISFVLTDRFTSALTNNYLLTPDTDRRLQMRVSTVSGVAKGTVAALWIIVGILIALSWIEVDIAPLLAGAGIIGLGLSLASQNLLKDAINGFFIILEDQYAVGDVISVGDVAGMVENINLRITQLRDAEGRLITIPNSEVKIVANLSSHWSRANVNIPVGYKSDINEALALINQVADEMHHDAEWEELILEPPLILGVEDFGDRGLVVLVWIKTQPLKQWDVSREFRRRIKNRFDEAGIFLPLPQQELWFHKLESVPKNSQKPGSQEPQDSANGRDASDRQHVPQN